MKKSLNLYLNIFLTALILVSIATVLNIRIDWLLSKEYPNSTDGFYYLQEFKYRLLTGSGYYVKSSVFFTIWTYIGSLFNLNELQIHNLIFISSLILFSAAILIHVSQFNQIKRFYFWPAIAIIYLYFSSDLLFYRHYAFLKQGFAVSLFFFGLVIFARENFTSRFLSYAGLALVFLASMMHIFAAGLASIYLLIIFSKQLKNRKFVILVLCCSFLYLLYNLYFHPKFLFSLNPISESGWWETCKILRCSEYETSEFYNYSVFLILAIVSAAFYPQIRNSRITLASLFVILLLNAPIWSYQGDMMIRLSVSSVWLFYILICDLAKTRISIIQFLVIFCVISSFLCYKNTVKKPYLSNRLPYNNLSKYNNAIKQWIDAESFILADHGYQFVLTYFLDRKSSDKFPKTEKISNYYELTTQDPYSPDSLNCVSVLGKRFMSSHTLDSLNCISIDNEWNILKLSGRK